MDEIKLRGKEIAELVSSVVVGDINWTIDYDWGCFTFKIWNGGYGWNWRGDIGYVMDISPNECAWKIYTAYRNWVSDTYFREEHLEDLLHSRN